MEQKKKCNRVRLLERSLAQERIKRKRLEARIEALEKMIMVGGNSLYQIYKPDFNGRCNNNRLLAQAN